MRPSSFERRFARMQFGYRQRKDLYNQLISLVGTGMSKTDALHMAWDVASEEGRKPKELTAIVLSEIILAVQNGDSLSGALKPWVPQEDVMVFEAIENSDDFTGNLVAYIAMLEKKKKIAKTIIGGLIYPAVLVGMVYGIMIYFGSKVVPQVAELLPMESWTGPSLFLTFMYDFSQSYAIPALVTAIAGFGLVLYSLPRWAGAGRVLADRMPIYATYRMYTGISFLMSMASLIQGGMQATDALNMLHPQASPYVRARILKVRNQMLNGANFGAALHRAGTNWPDRKMNLNIKIFAETQDLSAQLSRLSASWIEISQERIASGMALIRTIAMLMVFGVIMGIVVGIYSLQGQIGSQINAM